MLTENNIDIALADAIVVVQIRIQWAQEEKNATGFEWLMRIHNHLAIRLGVEEL